MSGGVPAGDFVAMVARLTHTGDDGWTPDDEDDATAALDRLIAEARRIQSTPTPPIEGRDADVERVLTILSDQQEAQTEEYFPSSLHRAAGRVWLEGWFDLRAALQAPGERG